MVGAALLGVGLAPWVQFVAQLQRWVDQYFAPIAKPAEPIPRVTVQEPPRTEARTIREYDAKVPLPALAVTWLAPKIASEETPALTILAEVLAGGESSRLYQSLVYIQQLAQNVDFSADLRLSQYTYPDDPRRINYNRSELTGTLGFRNRLFLAAIYSPNTRALASSPGYDRGDSWSLEASGRHAFNEHFSLSAGLGHYGLSSIYHDSYNYYNVTLTGVFAPFELQLAWLGVDSNVEQHFSEDSTGNRVAFTALWRFSTSP